MIVIRNVTVSKAGRKLFEDFSFEIRPGEHWIVQGDNGSGKSTLLQLIAGNIHPVSGKVHYGFIQENDWDSAYRARRENIHFIATYGLHALLPGVEGLFYQQRYYNMGGAALPRVRDIFGDDIDKLQRPGISDNLKIDALYDLELTRLSNGQLKKVIILRQLVRSIPQFLLLDYPFDGLDAGSRSDLTTFLDNIVRTFGIQLVLVDHGHTLPEVINRRLVLHQFRIETIENVTSHRPATTAKTVESAAAPAAGEVVVEMQDVTIAYGGKKIVAGVNWQIRKGERWALTGRNGSGKTTLFSLIYADHPMAYSQRVFLFGRRRGTGDSIWDIKKRINYMGPEQNHFLDRRQLTRPAREYLLQQSPTGARHPDALIRFFNAADYIDLPLGFLSSGQLQLVLLLTTFMDDKELLLLDEPFQFLDPHNRAKVTAYLADYLNREITLVLITHDEDDVARWTQKRKQL